MKQTELISLGNRLCDALWWGMPEWDREIPQCVADGEEIVKILKELGHVHTKRCDK